MAPKHRKPRSSKAGLFALAVTVLIASPVHAQETGIPGPIYTEALGIGLESWPYPYPVHFLDLVNDGQPVRMAYMDVVPVAPANGRTIVLLHGKNFDSSYWAGPIKALSGAGFRVLAPDQIGFNKSSKPNLDYSFDLLADNTAKLLDYLGIRRVDLLGHSTGGMLAVRFARTYLDRVDHLVLEDPIGLEDYRLEVPPVSTEMLEAAERKQTSETYRAFVRRYFPVLPAAEMEPFVAWRSRVALSGEFDRFVRSVALTYQMIYRQPVRYEFKLLAMPLLLVVGEKDRSAAFKNFASREVAGQMGNMPNLARQACLEAPRCSLEIVPGVGHVPHLEAADAFDARVLAFLR